MGIYNRDYLRDEYSPHSSGSGGRSMVATLIIVNVAVFVLQLITVQHGFIERWFQLGPQQVLNGQIWRLSTYDFLHDPTSIWHLLFNMWIFYLAGRKVEGFYGPRELLFFYLTAGIVSGVVFVGWALFLNSVAPAIGASGAVAAVMILYALNWPNEVWMIFGIIPIRVIWIAIITAALDLHPMLLQLGGADFSDGVAHSAHVGGMLFALVYQRRNWRIEHWLGWFRSGDWKRRLRPKAKLRVYQPETPVDLESRVDELLQKVAEQGEQSLTDAERAELVEASRRYRNRSR
ncbi:MAG: rhomboid family intramembrane serine protease [Planctomycetota bacterium]|nr:MAG: rhomboid family intramembrane serine protease [Planctomycetota bacterium]REJ87916.1 MAG: rhomboid family intramembrane serine protease [Planctomycetota bacterium]REK23252.1 MAG: rhomboid family intramembrane serine protease [Planctomycetota bacterium]REK30827.1 MAG: rhomboid family intramembrane serine protease [Planctomycetota bacterium]